MNKIRLNIDKRVWCLILALTMFSASMTSYSQTVPLVNIKGGAKVSFANGSNVLIRGSLSNGTNATLSLNGTIGIYGNWINNGTQTASATSRIEFIGGDNAEISGTGGSTQFYSILVNKDTRQVVLSLNTAPATSTPAGFVELRKGSFKVIGEYTYTNSFLAKVDGILSIPGTAEFWLENPNAVVEGQLADLILNGKLKITDGTFNASQALLSTVTEQGTELEIEDGTLNVGQRLSLNNASTTTPLKFTQTGGTINVATAGVQTNTNSIFEFISPEAVVNISGGEIVLKNENSTANVIDYNFAVNNATVTGGTLKIDAAAASQTFSIKSAIPIGNLLMTGTNNPVVQLSGNNLSVLKDVTIAGAGEDRVKLNGFDLSLGGDWNHNIAQANGLNQGTNNVIFTGNKVQKITATTIDPVFTTLINNKTGEKIVMHKPMSITSKLKLVGTTAIIDMQSNNLTIDASAKIFADVSETNESVTAFNSSKYIINSGSNTDPLLGAKLIRKLPALELGSIANIAFPIGTPNAYSPVQIDLFQTSTTLATDANIGVKVVPLEHPGVEVSNKSLKKYWNVSTSGITLTNDKAEIRCFYDANDAVGGGSEGYYRVAKYTPEWNTPAAYWQSEPGRDSNYVDFGLHYLVSKGLNNIDGDWTAAEQKAISGYYYSRQNGDYNDPNTWSKIAFGGDAAPTAPNKLSDRVYIQENVVTVTENTPAAKLIAVQTGKDGRGDGVLKIQNNFVVVGDTFKLEAKAKLYIGSEEGISESGATGNVQTQNRFFSKDAHYFYYGDLAQITGTGIPTQVAKLTIDKTATAKVTLSRNILISDEFHLINGIFDMSSSTLDGLTVDRKFKMDDGEFIVNSAFPINYTAPTFTNGQITFDGTGNITIPSSASETPIAQYYNLKISSASRSGNITLSRDGEIKIAHNLDISSLKFADNRYRFFTDGSTVRFNSTIAEQSIQFAPNSPADENCYLNYYNLIIDGANTVKITGTTSSTGLNILNKLTINNAAATFNANGFGINIHGDWVNTAGTFVQGTGTVKFVSDVASIATNIKSRSMTDNPFNNVIVSGPGTVKLNNDILINGNLTFEQDVVLSALSHNVNIKGDWKNTSGIFDIGTSNVIFSGTNPQNIEKTTGNATFNKLTIQNLNNVYAANVGSDTSGVIINNELALNSGNLVSHVGNKYKYVQINNLITRSGGGFVDGELRKKISAGAVTKVFEVGYNTSYTPVTFDVTGTAGSAGFVGVISDTINASSNIIRWNANSPTAIIPANSKIEPTGHIARRYGITIPVGSSFNLSNTRSYSAKVEFVPGDVKGTVNPQQFTMSVLTNPNIPTWVYPFSYEYLVRPVITEKTTTSTKMQALKDFGSIIVGVPSMITYYSRQTGNWNDPQSWSLEQYGGTAAPGYPGQTEVYRAYIGNGHTITMGSNITVNASSASGITENSAVIVDSANGAGTLLMGGYVINGTGEFRLLKYSTLSIGSSAGIMLAGNNTGNVQTTTRNYNYGNHNRGIFIYTGAGNSSTGNGLPSSVPNSATPDTLSKLIIDKTSGILTQWGVAGGKNVLRVFDELRIIKGNFKLSDIADAALVLYGDMTLDLNATFTPNSRTVWFRGEKQQYIQAGAYNQPIAFDRIEIDKVMNAGNITLKGNTNINVTTLNFSSINKVLIDANTHSSVANPIYVFAGTVTGAGQITETTSGGWVLGDMRRNVAAGAATVKFETGTPLYYAPFELSFANGTGSTAGVLSGASITGEHPMLGTGPLVNYPVSRERQLTVYWKLKRPVGSGFVRGNRAYTLRTYSHSSHAVKTDCIGCADLSFYRGGSINNNYANNQWQGLFNNNSRTNSDTEGFDCSDTRWLTTEEYNIPANMRFTYGGSSCTDDENILDRITVNSVGSDIPFGSLTIDGSNGDVLLADFVAGNRNTLKYYSFYSIKDGDWSDPTTWSTEGYNGTVNAAATDYSAGDIRPVPARQYDVAYIGNGKKVRADVLIGTNLLTPTSLLGTCVKVENTGTLDLGTTSLRGNQFTADPGSTLIIGANDGLNRNQYLGNVQLYYNSPIAVADSVNIVYSPRGRTVNRHQIPIANYDATSSYITSVRFYSATVSNILTYTSGDRYRLGSYACILMPASLNVNSGSTYSVTITANDSRRRTYSVSYLTYAGAWVEIATVTDVWNSTSSSKTLNFTIPADLETGTTLLRVQTLNNRTSAGEAELYTIHVTKPDYVANQVPGTALPSVLKSLTMTTDNEPAASQTFTLNKSLTIVDYLKFDKGNFVNGANTLNVAGDIISNNANTFNAVGGQVNLIDVQNCDIKGNASITFDKINLRKKDAIINLNTDVNIISEWRVDTLNSVNLADSRTLKFEANAGIYGYPGNNKAMIKVSGSENTGKMIKTFSSNLATGNRGFEFPFGIDTTYNPANIRMTGAYAANNSLTVQLFNRKHPAALNGDILKKYWKLETQGISNITASSLGFGYRSADTSGDMKKYIPARYASGAWEIDLGTNPIGKPDTINITNESGVSGEWTTGIPTTYFTNRIFYSRNTGSWDVKSNWSTDATLKHTGKSAAYYPGELYENDVVNIDGHTITLNDPKLLILDSIRIGGTNNNTVAGRLLFGNVANNQMFLRSVFLDADNGEIASENANSGLDTMILSSLFVNKSTGTGFNGASNLPSKVILKFAGEGNSTISGEGNYTSIGDIIQKKGGGFSDTLKIESNSFALATESKLTGAITPESGIIRNQSDKDLYLSATGVDVNMGLNSGIDCKKQTTYTRSSLITNTNTTINVDGGNLSVGTAANGHMLYKTGTTVTLTDGKIEVAGAFARFNENASVDLTIANKNTNNFIVNSIGNTSTDKIGFDLSNSASSISMSDGRILVANGGGTTSTPFDLRINAMGGSGLTGGLIISGVEDKTPAGTNIKIGGSTPLYDLAFINGVDNVRISTSILEQTMKIKNNWTITDRHDFNLNGNTISLGGNLTNNGGFTAVPAGATTGAWQLELDGAGDQTISDNSENGLNIHNFRVNKPTGDVILGADTKLWVRSTLEFSTDNNAIIKTGVTDMSKYVIVAPKEGVNSVATVIRAGKGHVDGYMGSWIPATASSVKFDIGGSTNAIYRPVEFQTVGANTGGIVMAKYNNTAHTTLPSIASSKLDKYWTVIPHTDPTKAFSLAEGQSYNLAVNYDNTELTAGTNELELEQIMRTPSIALNAIGTWASLNTNEKRANYSKSFANTNFGDVILGIPLGITYYSINSGDWNNPTNWSTTGYDGTSAADYPRLATDFVKIGNGKKIVVPSTLTDLRVNSVVVEKYNNVPGALQINGKFNGISGRSFVLSDDCTIGVQHMHGINSLMEGSRGAIITNSRTFGTSRYIYNSSEGAQITGNAIPNTIKTLILNNSTAGNNSLFLHNSDISGELAIQDTLAIEQGLFNTSDRNIRIAKAVQIGKQTNEGVLEAGTSSFIFQDGADKYIDIANLGGIRFYRIDLNNTKLHANRTIEAEGALQHVYVKNKLNFAGTSALFILGDAVNLTVESSDPQAITGFDGNKFVQTSVTSGSLIREVKNNSIYTFPIGSLENSVLQYAKADLTLANTGNSGRIGLRTSWGQNSNNAHKYLSVNANAGYMKRYWAVDSVTMQINGNLKFYYNEGEFTTNSTEDDMKRIVRWRPAKERAEGAWSFPVTIANLDKAANTFGTGISFDYTGFTGDWTLGNDRTFRRIFYSRQDGNWNSPDSWTFSDTHSGDIAGIGLFPNSAGDSVVIGGSKIITLNINNPFANIMDVGIQLGNTAENAGILKITNENILNGTYFNFIPGSSLYIGSANGISAEGTNSGNIQTTNRIFDQAGNYYYSGTSNQSLGNGLPNTVAGLGIANTGTENNNTVTFDRNISIGKLFTVISGTADIVDHTVTTTATDATMSMSDGALLRIGASNTPNTALTGFKNYLLHNNSTIEFYGTNQDISNVPLKFYDPNNADETLQGYGNVLMSNGTSYIGNKILLRGNYTINNASTGITIHDGTDAVRVLKNVTINGSLMNKGIIDVGNCE